MLFFRGGNDSGSGIGSFFGMGGELGGIEY